MDSSELRLLKLKNIDEKYIQRKYGIKEDILKQEIMQRKTLDISLDERKRLKESNRLLKRVGEISSKPNVCFERVPMKKEENIRLERVPLKKKKKTKDTHSKFEQSPTVIIQKSIECEEKNIQTSDHNNEGIKTLYGIRKRQTIWGKKKNYEKNYKYIQKEKKEENQMQYNGASIDLCSDSEEEDFHKRTITESQ